MSKREEAYKDVKISFESDVEITRNMHYFVETISEPRPIDLRMFPLQQIKQVSQPAM